MSADRGDGVTLSSQAIEDAFAAFADDYAEKHGPSHEGEVRQGAHGPRVHCRGCTAVWDVKQGDDRVSFERVEDEETEECP